MQFHLLAFILLFGRAGRTNAKHTDTWLISFPIMLRESNLRLSYILILIDVLLLTIFLNEFLHPLFKTIYLPTIRIF